MVRAIYDLGANNGDDIPYYLLRSDKVVVVEANPTLCDRIRTRFSSEIADGHLVVENLVVTDKDDLETVSFWIHEGDDALSRSPTPKVPKNFCELQLPSRSIVDLIRQHREPFYVKIDLEHFDNLLLPALFREEIRPPIFQLSHTQ